MFEAEWGWGENCGAEVKVASVDRLLCSCFTLRKRHLETLGSVFLGSPTCISGTLPYGWIFQEILIWPKTSVETIGKRKKWKPIAWCLEILLLTFTDLTSSYVPYSKTKCITEAGFKEGRTSPRCKIYQRKYLFNVTLPYRRTPISLDLNTITSVECRGKRKKWTSSSIYSVPIPH